MKSIGSRQIMWCKKQGSRPKILGIGLWILYFLEKNKNQDFLKKVENSPTY